MRDLPPAMPTPTEIEWVVVDGGLPEGLDIADRESMHVALLEAQRSLWTPTLQV